MVNQSKAQQLEQLGIPSWISRSNVVAGLEAPDTQLKYWQVRSNGALVGWVVAHHDAPEQLLSACLRATKLDISESDSTPDVTSELTLFLGLDLAQLVYPERHLSDSDYGIFHLHGGGAFAVTQSVVDMSNDASLKREVWQVLQQAMRRWQQ